jgi:hypothetical protein
MRSPGFNPLYHERKKREEAIVSWYTPIILAVESQTGLHGETLPQKEKKPILCQ